jgi:hypothetical protein
MCQLKAGAELLGPHVKLLEAPIRAYVNNMKMPHAELPNVMQVCVGRGVKD